MQKQVRLAVWIVVPALAAATGLGLLSHVLTEGRVGWALDLLSHWPKHFALAGLAVGVVAGLRRMWGAAGSAALVFAMNGVMVVGLGGFATPQATPSGAPLIRIVSANVHGSMPALERLAAIASAYQADVVAIYEAPEELTPEQFDGLFAGLPVRSLPGKRASNGWPLIRRSAMAVRAGPAIDTVMYDGSHGVLMRASLRGVQITSTHPPSPGDPGLRADRDRQLADISAGIDLDRPYIVAGDFNATPWSAAYETVPGARAGDPRFEGTFPAFLGALGLPIDHIKFGGGLVLVDYRAGPDIGSDHLPLVATFALPGN